MFKHILTITTIVSLHSTPLFAAEAKTRTTMQTIVDDCLSKNYARMVCDYRRNETPIKITKWRQASGKTLNAVVSGVSTIREVSATLYTYLLNGKNEEYWKRDDRWRQYKALRDLMIRKVEREKPLDCQKACLATCISSKIIKMMDYSKKGNDESLLTYWDGRRAIENDLGVCRQFSAIAEDLMESMGLKASYVEGYVYSGEVLGTSKYKKTGDQHAVVKVEIDNNSYLLEPQSDQCTFFESKWENLFEPIYSVYLQETQKYLENPNTGYSELSDTLRSLQIRYDYMFQIKKSLPKEQQKAIDAHLSKFFDLRLQFIDAPSEKDRENIAKSVLELFDLARYIVTLPDLPELVIVPQNTLKSVQKTFNEIAEINAKLAQADRKSEDYSALLNSKKAPMQSITKDQMELKVTLLYSLLRPHLHTKHKKE